MVSGRFSVTERVLTPLLPTRITATERVRFELAVERHSFLARREMNMAQEQLLDHWQASAVDRKAIERALVEHDYLLFRRRRLPLTVKVEKVTSCM